MERTYVMLKPETLQRGIVGEILTRIERKGYKITDMKMITLSDEVINAHYGHLKTDKYPADAFPDVYKQMTAGPVLAMVVEGEFAIVGMRKMAGPTKVENREPGTIRFDYCDSLTYSLIHTSDSVETAELEIKRFFA